MSTFWDTMMLKESFIDRRSLRIEPVHAAWYSHPATRDRLT